MKRPQRGFTLIELLVVVTILGILAGLSVAGSLKAFGVAASVKESAAAKTLITAYLTAASDNNGFLPGGYDRSAQPISLPNGTTVSGITAWRYPYRLAAYYNYDYKSTLWTSKNATQIDTSATYTVSAFPSFGINYLFVGGDMDTVGTMTHPEECLQIAGRGKGNSILVFATAGGGAPGDTQNIVQGYCKLEPPNYTSSTWSGTKWKQGANPGNYGQIDARHSGKAICAFTDGSVRKLSVEELRDMRLWSYRAADQGNPDYRVGAQ